MVLSNIVAQRALSSEEERFANRTRQIARTVNGTNAKSTLRVSSHLCLRNPV